ncbi:MAG: prepilin-type N-terminal cleavage/methylation domain-containing protein [Candidatus Pacebacteria bacterium]|nr:prepilin-type N-terminal cleavage/methylation domain-containing protein [Candidatus Paceibacterota bacterium]
MYINHINKKINGFTLIEVLVALSVITIGLVVVLQIFPIGLSVENLNQMETQAVFAAQDKIEALSVKSFGELVIGTVVESSLGAPYEKFARETKITNVDSNLQEVSFATGLKKVEVKVAWKSPLKGASKETKLSILFAER